MNGPNHPRPSQAKHVPISVTGGKPPTAKIKDGSISSRGFLGIVAGYGRLSTNGQHSEKLMVANSELLSTSFSDHRMNFLLPVSGICNGDSGGPTYNWDGRTISLVGVTSQGSCDYFDGAEGSDIVSYEFYLAISAEKYLSWIEANASSSHILLNKSRLRESDFGLEVDRIEEVKKFLAQESE